MKGIFKDKKRASALILGLSFIVAGASFAIPSLAWLAKAQTTAKLDGLEGEAHGSYFNGGDGSKGSPFQIDNARQLYYFNWLQDLGYFNSPNDGRTAIDQTYFVLTSDIDASGYTLPPAGTAEYPFVGNFDGGGKTISNLSISNSYAELTSPPVGAKSGSDGILSQAEVVGFFGVVGCTDSSGEVNGYKYDTSALEIKSLGISGASIKSSSSSTLAGLAAGYVNGALSGVAVDDSSIEVKEGAKALTDIEGVKSISDYSLVGYATEGYRSSTEVRDETMSMPQIENPNTEHGSTNWGGSVDMKQMYNDLKSERDSLTSDVKYVSSQTVKVDQSGKEYDPVVTGYSSTTAARGDYKFRNGVRTDSSDGKTIASYGLIYTDTSSDKYIYIYGKPSTTPSSSGATMKVTKNYRGCPTYISKNGHYLCLSSDAKISDGTDGSVATGWTVPSSGNSSYVYTVLGNTNYYLSLSSGALSISTSASTQWTRDDASGSLYYVSGTTTYYVDYDSGWTIKKQTGSSSYLTIKDATASPNMYIGYDGSSVKASTVPNSTTFAWGYDSSNGYYPLSNTSIYLGATKSWFYSSATVTVASSVSGLNTFGKFKLKNVTTSDGTGSGQMWVESLGAFSSAYHYLYYSGSAFAATSSNTTSDHVFEIVWVSEEVEKTGLSFVTSSEETTTRVETESDVAAAYYNNETYIPLAYSYEDEDSKSSINGVSKMNTGYLVGGANYVNSTDYAGDIRIAEDYDLSELGTAFNSSSSSYSSANMQVLTRSTTKGEGGSYSDNGWSRIKDSYNSANIDSYSSSLSSSFSAKVDSSIFSRYDSARRNLQYTIFGTYDNATKTSSSTLYGIHFMDASISMSHLSTVGKAVVYDKDAEASYQAELKKYASGDISEKPTQQGSIYENYEVPEDSIDFNLATDGYINFFGATYYSNSRYGKNDSFFSLNEITRDPTTKKITAIKEIKKVYANLGDDKKETPYLYSYDGSVPSGSDSSHMIFDVSWISTNATIVMDCLYYFEIPVNSGEYALGSVSGKKGSYVLYLDIGTGAANPESVTITEKTVSTIIRQSYPKGVDFSSSPASMPSPAGGGSACVAILVAPSKRLEYDYEGSALKVTADSSLKAVYIGDGVTVSGESGEEIESAISDPVTITMERTTVETFSPTNSTLSKIYSCTWTISGASVDDAYQLYFPAESATWASEDESKGTVASGLVTVKGEGDFKVTAEGSEDESASSDWQGPEPIVKTGVFGELKLSLSGGEASVEYIYDADSKTYVVTVHCDAAVAVTVLAIPSDASYKITVNGTEVTAVNQTIEVKATA